VILSKLFSAVEVCYVL